MYLDKYTYIIKIHYNDFFYFFSVPAEIFKLYM